MRVHDELLKNERLPPRLVSKHIWKQRFEDISRFERYLTHQGIVVRKFFLNVSKEEQKKRFLERLKEPEKHWKLSPSDVRERERWDDYMTAYEDMIAHTATEYAPWYVVPADNKWFTRVVVAEVIVEHDGEAEPELSEAGCGAEEGAGGRDGPATPRARLNAIELSTSCR